MRPSGIRAIMRADACATALSGYGPAKATHHGSSGPALLPLHLFAPLSSILVAPVFAIADKLVGRTAVRQLGSVLFQASPHSAHCKAGASVAACDKRRNHCSQGNGTKTAAAHDTSNPTERRARTKFIATEIVAFSTVSGNALPEDAMTKNKFAASCRGRLPLPEHGNKNSIEAREQSSRKGGTHYKI